MREGEGGRGREREREGGGIKRGEIGYICALTDKTRAETKTSNSNGNTHHTP